MTEYSFFAFGYKVTLKYLLNGWAWYLFNGAACLGGAGGFTDRELCETTAICSAETVKLASDYAEKQRKEVWHD